GPDVAEAAPLRDPEVRPYTYVTDPDDLGEVLEHLRQHPVVGVDIETTGLDPHTHRPRLLQLATAGHTYLIDAFRVDLTPLRPWFADAGVTKVIQTAVFETSFLLAAGIEVANVWDTELASRVLHAGEQDRKDKHSLAGIGERYLGVRVSKDL